MGAFINLEGMRFGKLIVTAKWNKKKTGKAKIENYYWECTCDCGKKKFVNACNLRNDKNGVNSCGCLHKEIAMNRLPDDVKNRLSNRKYRPLRAKGMGAAKRLYGHYRRQAKYKNRIFTITFEEFIEITGLNCHYCDRKPFQTTGYNKYGSRYNGEYVYNGIDRKDSSNGYELKNCLPCCGQCNQAKNDISYEDFLKLIVRIYKNTLKRP